MWWNDFECSKVVTEKSSANLKDECYHNKMISRNLGRITKIQEFCNKHGLSCRSISSKEDPIKLMIEALQTMVIKNEFKRVGENKDDISYTKHPVIFNGETLFCGYFTDDEIKDISEVDKRLKVE